GHDHDGAPCENSHSPIAFHENPEYKADTMNDSVRQSIVALVTRFADELLATVWNGLSAELEAGDARALPSGAGRRVRRTEDVIAAAAETIAAVLGRSAGGLRAEELRRRVGMTRLELARPLKTLLKAGRVKKTGEKRATVYSLGTAG